MKFTAVPDRNCNSLHRGHCRGHQRVGKFIKPGKALPLLDEKKADVSGLRK